MKQTMSILSATLGFAATLAGQPVPDFKLFDANFNSIRGEEQVSPRDYLFQVSAYYFGEAH